MFKISNQIQNHDQGKSICMDIDKIMVICLCSRYICITIMESGIIMALTFWKGILIIVLRSNHVWRNLRDCLYNWHYRTEELTFCENIQQFNTKCIYVFEHHFASKCIRELNTKWSVEKMVKCLANQNRWPRYKTMAEAKDAK